MDFSRYQIEKFSGYMGKKDKKSKHKKSDKKSNKKRSDKKADKKELDIE